ncbi:transposase, partial [Xenorhabdus szentirmaii]|uniref:transposase n=1 Tax=Xenorhabdus szentirmaii TaxID=290112 RepID=UPI0038CD57FB
MNNGNKSKTFSHRILLVVRLKEVIVKCSMPILWIARSGAPWRDLPDHYSLWKTVYARFCKWRDEGVLLTIFQEFNAE